MKKINDKVFHSIPFGEIFISQRNSTFDSRYKFTAKELDNETNYTYFGARYYDSDLSIWLSVDLLSDKYPSLSPYAYCANNPIRYTDPDGRRFIDANGNRVRVKAGKDGSISYMFSKNTSESVQNEFRNNHDASLTALAITKDGRSSIRFMNRIVTNIEIKPDNQIASDYSTIIADSDGNGAPKMIGRFYDKVTITPHMGPIEEKAQRDGCDLNEILGATMIVEAGHLKPKQIVLDYNDKKTEQQKYSKLYNSFVSFRYKYRKEMNQQMNQSIFNNDSEIKPELNRINNNRLKEVVE